MQFPQWQGNVESGWSVNFLGARTREAFFREDPSARGTRFMQTQYPPLNEEYMEWIDLLEAVVNAEGTFTMIELGAGWGRWLVNGAAAARQRGLLFHLIGAEAEPAHFEWLELHLKDNEVPAERATLYQAAVAGADGCVGFHVGDSREWYGQAMAELREEPQRLLGDSGETVTRTIVAVEAIGIETILRGLEQVDLIDADIQGAEAEVMEAGADAIDRAVKRVHIGTHSRDNEARLRSLFTTLRWDNINDYASLATSETPWGAVNFQDGVQTWVNPKLRGGG